MMGAGIYIERQFTVSRRMAKDIVLYWMESFEERHPDACDIVTLDRLTITVPRDDT